MKHIRKIPQQGYVYNVINKLIDNINYLLDYKADAVLSARSLELTIDNTTYKLNACLKDKDGNVISQIPEIELPIEELVVSGTYDETTNKIILILKSGQILEIPLTDLTNALQPKIDANNKLSATYISNLDTVLKTINGQSIVAANPGDNIQIEGAVYTALPGGGVIINSSNQISIDSTIFRTVADAEAIELTLSQAINDVNERAFDGYIEIECANDTPATIFAQLENYKTPGLYKINAYIASTNTELNGELYIHKAVNTNTNIIQYLNFNTGNIMAREYNQTTDTWANAQSGNIFNVQSNWNETNITNDAYIQNKPTALSAFTDDLGSNPIHTHSQYLTDTDGEVITRAIADLQQRVAALEAATQV